VACTRLTISLMFFASLYTGMMTESFIVLQIIYDNSLDKSEMTRACYNPFMLRELIPSLIPIWKVI
jgi:hypothetical protein